MNQTVHDHLNQLRDFRHQAYISFDKRADALFELLDAVKQMPAINSFVELSLAPAFKRQWHSTYAALSDSVIDADRINRLCLWHVPKKQELFFALDVMNVRRANSETLKERMICHGAQREAFGKGLIVGLPYSILAYCENAQSSWAMSVNTKRVEPEQKAVEIAASQIKWLIKNLDSDQEASVALDGSYGNKEFFRLLQGQKSFAVVRLRDDRLLYHRPREPDGKQGRDPKYGAEFKFGKEETYGEPAEVLEFYDEKHGKVRLEKWENLRFRIAKEVIELEVIRSQIHLEKEKPPKPRWYGIYNGTGKPTQLKRAYQTVKHRWTIEPANRFKKDRLFAEKPQVREAASVDIWLTLLQILEWEIYLWRPLAKDERMPWQGELNLEQLTPGRVLRSLGNNLMEVGTPARESLPRGKSPGWEKGRRRNRPERYKLKLKRKKKAREMEKIE